MLTLESHRWSVERGESQMWHIEYVVLIRRSVYMSVLLYVHLKNDVFPISLPLYQGNTPSLTNVITYPHCFQTACKRLWCLYIVGGASDSKNPELYYLRSIYLIWNSLTLPQIWFHPELLWFVHEQTLVLAQEQNVWRHWAQWWIVQSQIVPAQRQLQAAFEMCQHLHF